MSMYELLLPVIEWFVPVEMLPGWQLHLITLFMLFFGFFMILLPFLVIFKMFGVFDFITRKKRGRVPWV